MVIHINRHPVTPRALHISIAFFRLLCRIVACFAKGLKVGFIHKQGVVSLMWDNVIDYARRRGDATLQAIGAKGVLLPESL
jgi:hypothetical protein